MTKPTWHEFVRPAEMLVDRDKHRIAKIDGAWRMYCPERGPDSLIRARNWLWVQAACTTACPHGELLGEDFRPRQRRFE